MTVGYVRLASARVDWLLRSGIVGRAFNSGKSRPGIIVGGAVQVGHCWPVTVGREFKLGEVDWPF